MPENTDAKETTAPESSTEAQTTQTAESSTATTATQGDVAPKTAAQVAREAFERSSSEQEKAEKGGVQDLDTTEKVEKQEEVSTEVTKNEEPDKQLPFHDHPRFQELIKERNTFKQQYEEAKPLVESQRSILEYCQANGITPELFQEGMQTIALLNTNPDEAKKKLRGMLEQMGETFGPESMPEDLAKRVTDGEISENAAKEMWDLRKQVKAKEAASRNGAQAHARAVQQGIESAVWTWDQATRAKDPDFKPKAQAQDRDGKYELFVNYLRSRWLQGQPRTAQEATAMAERAYQDVVSLVDGFRPKASPTKPIVTSTSSSRTKEAEPKTARDVVRRVAAKHGLSLP